MFSSKSICQKCEKNDRDFDADHHKRRIDALPSLHNSYSSKYCAADSDNDCMSQRFEVLDVLGTVGLCAIG